MLIKQIRQNYSTIELFYQKYLLRGCERLGTKTNLIYETAYCALIGNINAMHLAEYVEGDVVHNYYDTIESYEKALESHINFAQNNW